MICLHNPSFADQLLKLLHSLDCSFGHMMDPERVKSASKADLARSCLAMITYNISSLARLNAEKQVSQSCDLGEIKAVHHTMRIVKMLWWSMFEKPINIIYVFVCLWRSLFHVYGVLCSH